MWAMEVIRYGPAREAIRLNKDAPAPEIAADQILIRAVCCSVNPVDCAAREGYGRVIFKRRGFTDPPFIPGRDVSGVVEAIGDDVRNFNIGDEVFALTNGRACAGLVAARADLAQPKPAILSHAEAASFPFVALSSWAAVVELAGLHAETTAASGFSCRAAPAAS